MGHGRHWRSRERDQGQPRLPSVLRPCTADSFADGTFIQERGEARVAVEIDGARHVIPFKDMDVSMPIAPMRRTIKCGNRLVIEEDGGTITDKTTGHQIKLHERRGIYFFTCKILPPTERTDEADRTSGFMRQG